MRVLLHILVLVVALTLPLTPTALAQDPAQSVDRRAGANAETLEEGRAALDRNNYARAVTILEAVLRREPSADAYLYLGMAYGREGESVRAEQVLTEGARRYPGDPRFHNELAETYLGRRDDARARASLKAALAIDPSNGYASDLLAQMNMRDGDVRSAIEAWNRNGSPRVDEVLHNRYPNFGHWTIGKSLAFKTGDTLHYRQWRTTELRLFETGVFTNAGVDIEPAKRSGYYSVTVRTSSRTTTLGDVIFGLVKGAPFETSYLDVWNPAKSGLSINSMFRWQSDRRRAGLRVMAPIPVPGILFAEFSGVWRSERWDVSRRTLQPSSLDLFDYGEVGGRFFLKYIPDYRVEFGAGLEYRNRSASGGNPALFADSSSNTSKLVSEIVLRPVDRQSFHTRIRMEGFLARRGFHSDLDYSGGVVQAAARWDSRSVPRASMVWTFTGGTSRGEVPIDDYFVLGVEANPRFLLRGHPVTRGGLGGSSPLASAFLLANYTAEGLIAKIPTFHLLNMPHLVVKGELFMDAAKAFDRARIFRQEGVLLDVGVGLQLATPSHALHLIYGQSTTDGRHALTAYLEKIW